MKILAGAIIILAGAIVFAAGIVAGELSQEIDWHGVTVLGIVSGPCVAVVGAGLAVSGSSRSGNE